ncbi:MAG: RraA family protein [Ectothiorhodospiraceae bacterium]|nr:RraA family protein [Ectothiorhodospiraceae bacterium]
MSEITAADLKALCQWDTPTICNALEVVVPERRATGFTVEHMQVLDPTLAPICGYARTATCRAATPSPLPAAEARELRARYYEYVASAPGPTVTVIQDLDPIPGFGAFWGEVNTAIHKGLGCLGAVTNGSIRDLDACAKGFQLLAGKVGPSHAHVHVVDFGCEVNVLGMAVLSGDIIHADRHGAVVVPASAVKALPAAVDLLTRREAVILEAARAPGFDAAKLRKAMSESADIH